MCRWCDTETDETGLSPEQRAQQRHVLRLLGLVEHPDALPPADALRIGQEILALLDEIDDACDDFLLARPGLPRLRGDRLSALPIFN
ncbi:hypothetical protein [Ferrovibrio xuzhouensis]|uniref:Uncharacterized protein n=1 Tax=Ferrovibrio xuzhouensis TaxID=1576914 RepID=A0ABV7VCT0_9PROT